MSLGDFWDNQVPDEWRIEALNMIGQCHNLDWNQTPAEHPQDAATGLGGAGMVARLARCDCRKHGRGAAANSNPAARARPCALAIRRTSA